MSLLDKLEEVLVSSNGDDSVRGHNRFIYDLVDKSDGSGYKTIDGVEGRQIEELRNPDEYEGEPEVYMGEYPRNLIEESKEDPYSPLYFGYHEDESGSSNKFGIPIDKLFKHAFISGKTGVGKSTLLKLLMLQLAYGGYGFTYVDPKGDDAYDLLQMLPEDRLEDVIFIKAEQPSTDTKTVGFNYLSVPVDKDHPYYESFVNSQVDFVKDAVAGKDGKRMVEIIDNISKAMVKSEKNYTLIDIFYILVDQDSREQFAAEVREEQGSFIAKYTEKIAGMDDDELEPVYRRIRRWTENTLTREMVAHPNTTIPPVEIVNEDKIVIIDSLSTDESLRRFYAMSIIEQIWGAVRKRKELGKEPKPYFMVVDEFASLFREENSSGKIGQILSEARSFKLSFIAASQSPNQIPTGLWDKDIVENVNTFITLKVGQNAAGRLANEYPEFKAQKLQNLPRFKSANKIEKDGTHNFTVNHFADYPPVRDKDAVESIVKDSLERYGEERLTEEEMEDNLIIGKSSPGSNDNSDDIPQTIERIINATYYALVYESESSDKDILTSTYISEEVVKTILTHLYSSTKDYEFSSIIEENSEYIGQKQSTEGVKMSLTREGVNKARSSKSGASGSGGKSKHKLLLKDSKDILAKYGFGMTIPSQGGESLPDGVGNPLPLTTPDKSEFKYPYVGEIFEKLNSEQFAVEAETTTPEKPAQSIRNLAKAYTQNDYVLFTVTTKKDIPRKLEQVLKNPPGVSREYENGSRLYNFNDSISKDTADRETAYVLRPAENRGSVWVEKDGEYYLVPDASAPIDYNNALAHFESLDDFNNFSLDDYPAHYIYSYSKGYVVYQNGQEIAQYESESKDKLFEEWSKIKKPFIIENEFGGISEIPSDDHYSILVIPPEDSDEEIHFRRNGEKYPLTLSSENDSIESDSGIGNDVEIDETDVEDAEDDSDSEVMDAIDEALVKGASENDGQPPTVRDERSDDGDEDGSESLDEEDEDDDEDDTDNPFL